MASSDIVERLKSAAKPLQHMGNEEEELAAAAIEAADEIEKLRAELEAIRAEAVIMSTPVNPVTLRDAMRAALRISKCPHGNPWGECNDCDVASDHAYDAAREDRMFRR